MRSFLSRRCFLRLARSVPILSSTLHAAHLVSPDAPIPPAGAKPATPAFGTGFGSAAPAFGATSAPAFGAAQPAATSSFGFGGFGAPATPATPATTSAFSFGTSTTAATPSLFGAAPGGSLFGQPQQQATPAAAVPPATVASTPYGTLPQAMLSLPNLAQDALGDNSASGLGARPRALPAFFSRGPMSRRCLACPCRHLK